MNTNPTTTNITSPHLQQDLFGSFSAIDGLTPIRFQHSDLTSTEITECSISPLPDLQQRSHEYYTDSNGCVRVGICEMEGALSSLISTKDRCMLINFLPECTAVVTITNIDSGGKMQMYAGQGVSIPQGAKCVWESDGIVVLACLCFFPSMAPPCSHLAHAPQLGEVPIAKLLSSDLLPATPEYEVDMTDGSGYDTARYLGPLPTQHFTEVSLDPSKQLACGVWDTTDMHTSPRPFPGNPPVARGSIEMVLILEGCVMIRNGAGEEFNFKAGDAYLIPKGMMYEWHSTGFTKKIVCGFQMGGFTRVQQPGPGEP